MINCYLSPITNCCNYKKRWQVIVYDKLKSHNQSQFIIVDDIKNAYLIFCIYGYYNNDYNCDIYKIYQTYKNDFDENKKKFVLICCRDTLLNTINETFDKYVLCYLEQHIKIPIISNKILCILNTSHIFYRQYINDIIPLKNRIYDVVFLGTLNYTDNKITQHRKELCEKLIEICKNNKFNYIVNSSISIKQYYKILKKTKIFVSPYGWGEWSLKDYECICYGCHVVKPNIYYESYPNYYKNMDHYNDDLSQLEPLLIDLLYNKIDIIQEKVNKNRQLFINYNIHNDDILKKIENIQVLHSSLVENNNNDKTEIDTETEEMSASVQCTTNEFDEIKEMNRQNETSINMDDSLLHNVVNELPVSGVSPWKLAPIGSALGQLANNIKNEEKQRNINFFK
jgi:hypothetical protein